MVADGTRTNRCRNLDSLVERCPYVLAIRAERVSECNRLISTTMFNDRLESLAKTLKFAFQPLQISIQFGTFDLTQLDACP